MIRSVVSRGAAAVAAAVLLVGVGVAAGSGVATADQASGFANVRKTFENIDVEWFGPGSRMEGSAYVQAGQEIRFQTMVRVREGAERVLTRITSHGPAGFEYVPGSAQLSVYGPEGTPPGSVTQEIGPGTVSVAAPEDGWLLTPTGGTINLFVTYRAPQKIPTGTEFRTGVTFDVAGHEGSVGWPDMGKVTIVADPDPFGLGSLADPFGSSGGKGYPQGNL